MRRGPVHPVVLALLAVGALTSACSEYTPTPTAPMMPPAPPPSPDPAPGPTPTPAPERARYVVTFDATWAASTHPQDFPDNAHFSGLIGGTHQSGVTFWQPGSLATEGIRAMAERGQKAQLQGEVEQAIATGAAEFVLSGGNLDISPASVSLGFEVTQQFPLVTLVTMVAPSPDWFVGVSGYALFENGAWKDDIRVDLFAYDAGTDSGLSFESPDEETRPRQSIARLTGFPFLNGSTVLPLGSFRFQRVE